MSDVLTSQSNVDFGSGAKTGAATFDKEKSIALRVAGVFGQVALVGVSLQAMCRHCGYAEDISGRIQIAVVEAINNIIEHAYAGDSAGYIDIDLRFRAQSIEVTLMDDGIAHQDAQLDERDPNALPDLLDQEALPEGGFGLMLMTMVMDKVIRDRVNNRNRLRMTKWLTSD